jgi:hypothetical protein
MPTASLCRATRASRNATAAAPNANYLCRACALRSDAGGSSYNYFGHTDVKELALYIEDEIKAGNWDFNLGLREDVYNGLTDANQTEPRWALPTTSSPPARMRVSYARTLETPFNENLVLSSNGCSNRGAVLRCSTAPRRFGNLAARLPQRVSRRPAAGPRQECGLQRRVHLEVHPQRLRLQRAGQYADHLPHRLAQLQDSGLCAARSKSRVTTTSAPISSGRRWPRASSAAGGRSRSHERRGADWLYPFRIDHDEKLNETTHVQYTFFPAASSSGCGAALTGALTRAWWPDRRRATAPPTPTALARNIHHPAGRRAWAWRWSTTTSPPPTRSQGECVPASDFGRRVSGGDSPATE